MDPDRPLPGRLAHSDGDAAFDDPEFRDAALVAALRARDEETFAVLVDRYSPSMLRLAQGHVPSRAIAEEVVQDTWLAVLQGIDRFEGRSSFKTWLYRILLNTARTRGVRERRTVPVAQVSEGDGPLDTGPTVDRRHFRGDDDAWPGHWVTPPLPWPRTPEDASLAVELRKHLADAMENLPERQRAVIVLRDVHGWSSDEVCEVLSVSAANQRVLLHRARSAVRQRVESYVGGAAQP